MKKLLCLIALSFMLISCAKENNNPVAQQNKFFTDDLKAKLEHAADSVFMQVSTPGMIAIISAEGEDDFIMKRGVSNIATGEAMNENYFFRIASNTKTFAGLAVLILVDEGKINLDSSISYYLPEYNIPNGNLIKIRMLGNMTSGLYNYSDDENLWADFQASNFMKTYSPDSLLAIAFSHSPNFPPGTSYEYCNTGIVLLGLLMEKVTGLTAKQVIEQKILIPLNLSNTYWPNSVYLPAPYIHGYTTDFGSLMETTNWNPSWGYTAGVMISKFSDMKRWAKIVADGTLLSEQMKAERFNWVQNHYGFCVMKAGNWIGHAGNIYGFNSHVLYNPIKKITYIVLTNCESHTPVEYFTGAFIPILDK